MLFYGGGGDDVSAWLRTYLRRESFVRCVFVSFREDIVNCGRTLHVYALSHLAPLLIFEEFIIRGEEVGCNEVPMRLTSCVTWMVSGKCYFASDYTTKCVSTMCIEIIWIFCALSWFASHSDSSPIELHVEKNSEYVEYIKHRFLIFFFNRSIINSRIK